MDFDAKKPWTSKTLWTALFMAIIAFFPPVMAVVKENPEAFTFIVAGVFGILRLVTKGKIDIS